MFGGLCNEIDRNAIEHEGPETADKAVRPILEDNAIQSVVGTKAMFEKHMPMSFSVHPLGEVDTTYNRSDVERLSANPVS